ncbi:D-2-hydroxyacid dehydrogenase family protein [Terrarubrum flagellatum]|uniref:D-2-hydroxyacid dehydrogenase family protein n=1 Tax=Terrirubrum flagellatum TaxID=2895980 RepID=UPI003145469D
MAERLRIAVLDDSQHVARDAANWSALQARAEIDFFDAPLGGEAEIIAKLSRYDVLVPMRERTAFPASVINALPNLKFIALTGGRAPSLDMAACTARGILICNTRGDFVGAATPELAWGLMLACMRSIPQADASMKRGGWHDPTLVGATLGGKRLGVVGLGKLGGKVAHYGRAFDMEVVGWSQNLTDEDAKAKGATRVDKNELFATSDVISLHLVLSDRTRGIVGAPELSAMKDGAVLINTSRGPLIDEAALIAELKRGRIRAGLDVFDVEPLPTEHPLRALPNVVLTPHLGYSVAPAFRQFYSDSIENILAWLDGKPIRMLNPNALGASKA